MNMYKIFLFVLLFFSGCYLKTERIYEVSDSDSKTSNLGIEKNVEASPQPLGMERDSRESGKSVVVITSNPNYSPVGNEKVINIYDLAKEQQEAEKKYEKKVGYKFCEHREVNIFSGVEFPKNCIFMLLVCMTVSQQIPGGTLGQVANSSKTLFIVKNSIDGAMADNSPMKQGYFVRTGNYQYLSLLGTRTVQKLKRLPDMEGGKLAKEIANRFKSKNNDDREEQFMDEEEQQKVAKERKYEKKVGYRFCPKRHITPLAGTEFPRNCIFSIPHYFVVSQQTSDGTLVREAMGPLSFFIVKNKVDASKVDNSPIKRGYFVRTGNYQYMSLLGVRTVQKLKRLPDM